MWTTQTSTSGKTMLSKEATANDQRRDDDDDGGGEKCPRASQSFTRIKLNKIEKWNCCCCDFVPTNWVSLCVRARVWARVNTCAGQIILFFSRGSDVRRWQWQSTISIFSRFPNNLRMVRVWCRILFEFVFDERGSDLILLVIFDETHTNSTEDTGKWKRETAHNTHNRMAIAAIMTITPWRPK